MPSLRHEEVSYDWQDLHECSGKWENGYSSNLPEYTCETKSPYCAIGGLAVNAYVEPVVSLDLDIVVAMEDIEEVCKAAKRKGLRVENLSTALR